MSVCGQHLMAFAQLYDFLYSFEWFFGIQILQFVKYKQQRKQLSPCFVSFSLQMLKYQQLASKKKRFLPLLCWFKFEDTLYSLFETCHKNQSLVIVNFWILFICISMSMYLSTIPEKTNRAK